MKRLKLVVAMLTIALIGASASELKYIFYFIGDGMGLGHSQVAAMYRKAMGNEEPFLMRSFPYASTVTTYSWSSPVTDSAAAGTALSTGHKTRNNMVGMAPDTTEVYSIAARLQQLGYGIGIITSNAPDDATPASFYGHAASRKQYYDIGCQAVESGYEFIGGAELRGLRGDAAEAADLQERIRRANIGVAYGLEEFAADTEHNRMFVFTPNRELNNTLGYIIDSIENTFTLPELTQACLSHLERVRPESFFMMIENGMTDWSSHSNDAGTFVREYENLDNAVAVAYEFYLAHPEETLIVITADHDTGGLSVGNDNPAIKYDAHLELLALQHMSKDTFARKIKTMMMDRRVYSWEDMEEILRNDFGFWAGVPVTEEETARLKATYEDMLQGRAEGGESTLYADHDAFAVEVFKVLDAHTGAGWISTYHTGNMVPVYAIGVDAERFGHIVDNTEIPTTILNLVETSNSERPLRR